MQTYGIDIEALVLRDLAVFPRAVGYSCGVSQRGHREESIDALDTEDVTQYPVLPIFLPRQLARSEVGGACEEWGRQQLMLRAAPCVNVSVVEQLKFLLDEIRGLSCQQTGESEFALTGSSTSSLRDCEFTSLALPTSVPTSSSPMGLDCSDLVK